MKTNKTFFATILVVIFTFIISSCSSHKTMIYNLQASLENTQWKLSEKIEDKVPTISILEGKASGNGGCNTYNAEADYDAKTGNFIVKNIISTKMTCGNVKLEQQFFEMLTKVTNYKVNNNVLELYSGKLLLLKFNRIQ